MDAHSNLLLEQYNENLPTYEKVRDIVVEKLEEYATDFNTLINSITSRIKTEKSLTGKLKLKGSKYKDIFDVTDIVGARVVTFYADDACPDGSIRTEIRSCQCPGDYPGHA